MEARLVLESIGIESHAIRHDREWILAVATSSAPDAIAELEDYRRDDAVTRTTVPARVRVFSGASIGAFGYAVVISLCSFYAWSQTFGLPWESAGRVQAGDVVAGQWWRVLTALTLHADVQHLMSNVAFGCVFGLMAGRILGGGIAWLAITVAGAVGNLLNAMLRESDHMSIGASTAVFAALGVLVAHALRPRSTSSEKLMKRWSPLICGVLLLAMIGVGGERTDVGAHVTGFLSGLLVGWLGCRLPERWLASGWTQTVAGCLAAALIAMAWIVALIHRPAEPA